LESELCKNPKLSIEVFNTFCTGFLKSKLHALTSTPSTSETVIMGVIVESSGIKKSAADKEYMIWQLSDLTAENYSVKILLFGDAAQGHWKLQAGRVVAITSAELATDKNNSKLKGMDFKKQLTLKVTQSNQIMEIGLCPEFGICGSQRKDGTRCTNYVNTTLSETCSYHMQNAANKMRSGRASLSAVSNEKPKCALFRSPMKVVNSDIKTVSRPRKRRINYNGDFTVGYSVIAAKARLGSKLMRNLSEALEKENNMHGSSSAPSSNSKTQAPASNLKDFLKKRTMSDRIRLVALKKGPPQLGRSVQRGKFADLSSPQKAASESHVELENDEILNSDDV